MKNPYIKKLRYEFMAVMMSIAAVFLVAVFTIQYFSTKNEFTTSGREALRAALGENSFTSNGVNKYNAQNPPEDPNKTGEFGINDRKYSRTPVLVIAVDNDGNCSVIRNDMFFLQQKSEHTATASDALTDPSHTTVTGIAASTELAKSTEEISEYGSETMDNAYAAARVAITENKSEGELSDYDFYYMKKTDSDGTVRVAFIDYAKERSVLMSDIKSALLISAGVIVVMFIMSLFLSKAVLMPVAVAWNDQQRFTADASHELKTPLTVIISNAELMAKSENYESAKNRRRLDNIRTEAARMKELVLELLEIARGDMTEKSLIKEEVNLSEIIEDDLLSWEPPFFESHKTRKDEIEENIYMIGDASKLRRLADILIDNALKYSDSDSEVTVILKKEEKAEPRYAYFSVTDFGTPMTEDEQKKVFERFYRSDYSREETPGYGLGLAIASKITEEHNGTIKASSNGKDRNTFTVRFPIRVNQIETSI